MAVIRQGTSLNAGVAALVSNRTPVFTVTPPTATITATERTIQFTATDADGDAVSYSIDPPVANYSVNASGLVTAASGAVSATITVVADDGALAVRHTCSITVSSLGEFPVYDLYVNIVANRGGTPITNARYWSARPEIPAGETVHATVAALNAAIAAASAGAIHKLQNGTYDAVTITIPADRTGVIVAAQTVGGAVLRNSSSIVVNGDENDVLGFGFTTTTTSSVSSVQLNGDDNRLARCVVDGIERPNQTSQYHTIDINGVRNRVCYNTFDAIHGLGRAVNIVTAAPGPYAVYNRVDHNQFLNCYGLAENSELWQVGQAQYGTPYYALFDSNYVYRWNNIAGTRATTAEPESMTFKSDRNMAIHNVWKECLGTFNIRQGAQCDVYGNWSLGGGLDWAGGIGVAGANNRVLCNYLADLNNNSQNTRAALRVSGGDVQPGGNEYAADACEMSYNTIVNTAKPIVFQPSADPVPPSNNTFKNNAVEKTGTADAVTVANVPADTGTTWTANVIERVVGRAAAGIIAETPELTLTGGYYVPSPNANCDGTAGAGASAIATVDILGNPIPGSGANIGCFQDGWNFTLDPVAAIISAAGAT